MASTIFVHVGLPKTGTTYLQRVLWENRDQLRAAGVVFPGRQRRDHLWASRHWRKQPGAADDIARWEAAWNRIRAEIEAWDGTAVISHEFFAAASAEQAAELIAELAPAEVHLVVTAREPVSLFTSSWQESLKNRSAHTFAEYAAAPVSAKPTAVWNWRSLDVRLVLERWAGSLDPSRVHVLPLSPEAPPTDLWHRFATVIGISAGGLDLPTQPDNTSLGAVEAETLRRVNASLGPDDLRSAFDRGVYLRSLLADRHLGSRDGDRFWPDDATIRACRSRAADAVAAISRAGYDVEGDLEDLLPPEHLDERRLVDSVTETEVAAAATAVIGELLVTIRTLTRERNHLRRQVAHAHANPSLRRALLNRLPWRRA